MAQRTLLPLNPPSQDEQSSQQAPFAFYESTKLQTYDNNIPNFRFYFEKYHTGNVTLLIRFLGNISGLRLPGTPFQASATYMEGGSYSFDQAGTIEDVRNEGEAFDGLTENVTYLFLCAYNEFVKDPKGYTQPNFLFWLRVYCVFTQRFTAENVEFQEVYTLAACTMLFVTLRINYHHSNSDGTFGASRVEGSLQNNLAIAHLDNFILALRHKEQQHPEPGLALELSKFFTLTFPLDTREAMFDKRREGHDLRLSGKGERWKFPTYSGCDCLLRRQEPIVLELHSLAKSRYGLGDSDNATRGVQREIMLTWRHRDVAPVLPAQDLPN